MNSILFTHPLIQNLNPAQAEAVMAPLNTSLRIMAGAGTGKTRIIAHRFVKLAMDLEAQGIQDPATRLWVSTFTVKAAEEMRDRIIQLFPVDPAQLWVGTFHSLCQRILKDNAEKVSVIQDAQLLSDLESDAFKEALVQFLLLNPPLPHEVLLAWDLGDYEALFTEIVFDVIPRLKAYGLSPEAFKTQATEQTEALSQLLQTLPGSFTSHEEFARAWERHFKALSVEGFTFMPSDLAIEIAAQKKTKKKPDSLLKDMLKPFYDLGCYVTYNGRNRKAPFTPGTGDFDFLQKNLVAEEHFIELITVIYTAYQHALVDEKALDYDDLISQTVALLIQNPEIHAHYQDQFKHYLVDEFQDANGLQLQLMALLAQDNLTVVGDEKQSIYGFRFAEPQNLNVLFEKLPNVQTLNLQTNYRSHPDILAVANRVTELMNHGPEQMLYAGSVFDVQEAVVWHTVEDKPQETAWITEQCRQLIGHQVKPDEIAVLVSRNTRALDIEEALEEASIPAVRQRNHGFFNDPVIQQAVSLLTLVENPEDDRAVVSLMQQKLSHQELYAMAKQPKLSWFSALKNDDPVLQMLDKLHAQKAFLTPPEIWDRLTVHKNHKRLNLLGEMITYWTNRAYKPRTFTEVLALIKRAQLKNDLALPFGEASFAENAVRILTLHGAKGLEFPVVFLAGVTDFGGGKHTGLLTADPQYPGKPGFGLILNRHDGEKTLKRVLYETVWQEPREDAEALRLLYVGVTRAQNRLFISSGPRSLPTLNPVFFKNLHIQIESEACLSDH